MAFRVHLLCGQICPTLFWPDRPYSLVCLGYTWATAKIEVGGIVAITGKVYFLHRKSMQFILVSNLICHVDTHIIMYFLSNCSFEFQGSDFDSSTSDTSGERSSTDHGRQQRFTVWIRNIVAKHRTWLHQPLTWLDGSLLCVGCQLSQAVSALGPLSNWTSAGWKKPFFSKYILNEIQEDVERCNYLTPLHADGS